MRKIAICGSMQFYDEMVNLKEKLEKLDYRVVCPISYEEMGELKYKNAKISELSELKIKHDLIRGYYNEILSSDAVLIANYDKSGVIGYIGGNTLLEMGFAHIHNRDIFMVNPIPSISYTAEIDAMQPMIVGEDMNHITDYYQKLPKVFVSSDNQLKTDATSFGFRECGIGTDVYGHKTNSSVSEQPMDIDETYKGAENRLQDLKTQVDGKKHEYLVSIESGLVKLHINHNYFGVIVCIIENKHGDCKVSISSDLEFTKDMTDKLGKYPDLGIYVQKELESKYKDPFWYLSNGKVTRLELLTNVVKNTIAQF